MKIQRARTVMGFAAATWVAFLVGCSDSGPERGEVSGTVLLDGQPVADAALHRGDVLHFGDFEFRIASENGAGAETADTVRTMIHRGTLSRQFATGASDIRDLLKEEKVTMVFQPIVDLPGLPSALDPFHGNGGIHVQEEHGVGTAEVGQV